MGGKKEESFGNKTLTGWSYNFVVFKKFLKTANLFGKSRTYIMNDPEITR